VREADLEDAVRQYTICNACRYCEGYCPVWPTLSSLTFVDKGDVVFMANLCLDRRDCYYACPYVPGVHEFAINIPEINRRLRDDTYRDATFNVLGSTWGRIAFALMFLPILALWALFAPAILHPGATFYGLVPKYVIIYSGTAALVYLVLIAVLALIRYSRIVGPRYRPRLRALPGTVAGLLRHDWFSDAHYPREVESDLRLAYHLLIFYGFLMDLISTLLGMVYEDILHVSSPFPAQNPTVITGLVGGVMLLAGTALALYARIIARREQKFSSTASFDVILAVLLMSVAVTGLVTLAARLSLAYGAMYALLLAHYSLIYALFVLAPLSSTFLHALLRPYSLWIYNSVVGKRGLTVKLRLAADAGAGADFDRRKTA
jgi:citrate/tricarballylate utilization protein